MKTLIIAGLAAALACGTASAQTTGMASSKDTVTAAKPKAVKKHHSGRRADGYYAGIGIPKRDPGRYSNLPGKDSLYSKSYIQDH